MAKLTLPLTLAFAAAAAAALTAASPSVGDTTGVVICGPKDCAVTHNDAAVTIPFSYNGLLAPAAPVPPQPFYAIGLGVDPSTPGGEHAFYIPNGSLIRVPGGKGTLATWLRLSRAAAAALRTATANLASYPAPTHLREVIVNHSIASSPSSYLRLYTIGTPTRNSAGGGSWIPVSLLGDATPWTDGLVSIAVSRQGSLLKRNGQLLTIPATVAARVRAGRSLGK